MSPLAWASSFLREHSEEALAQELDILARDLEAKDQRIRSLEMTIEYLERDASMLRQLARME
jgi:hypothetical protein